MSRSWMSEALIAERDEVFSELPVTLEVGVQWSVCPTRGVDCLHFLGKDASGRAIQLDTNNGFTQAQDRVDARTGQSTRVQVIRVAAPHGKLMGYWKEDCGRSTQQAIYDQICEPLMRHLITKIKCQDLDVANVKVRPALRKWTVDHILQTLRIATGEYLQNQVIGKRAGCILNTPSKLIEQARYSQSPVSEPPAEAGPQVFLPNQGIW